MTRGLTEAYNLALALSRGDVVVFSHDDVEFLADDFLVKLRGHMGRCDVLGVAGTRRLSAADWIAPGIPYVYGQMAYHDLAKTGNYEVVIWSASLRRVDQIQAMDGVFLCAYRPVAQVIGFDQDNFRGFHFYDLDFTFRAFLAGYKLAVACDLFPIHESGGRDDEAWTTEANLFLRKFGRNLAPLPPWGFRGSLMVVPSREDVIRVMTPPHWED